MAGEATKLKQYRGSILKADLNCLGSQLKDSILDKNTAYVDTQASTTLKSRIKALTKRCQRMKQNPKKPDHAALSDPKAKVKKRAKVSLPMAYLVTKMEEALQKSQLLKDGVVFFSNPVSAHSYSQDVSKKKCTYRWLNTVCCRLNQKFTVL